MTPFVDLGRKDEYSLKHAMGNTLSIIPTLKERNQKWYAVSNYGEISNWVQQLFACKDNGIVPILGMETFVCNYRARQEGTGYRVLDLTTGKEQSIEQLSNEERDLVTMDFPLDIFARTIEGYYNVIQIHNDAQLNGMGKRPRTSDMFLASHGKGVVAVLPVPYSEVGTLLYNGLIKDAIQKLKFYSNIFDAVYLGLPIVDDSEYGSIDNQAFEFGRQVGISCIPIGNAHYQMPDDEDAFTTLRKLARLRSGVSYELDATPGMFYRSREELDALFQKTLQPNGFSESNYLECHKNLEALLETFQTLEIDTSLKLPKFEDGAKKLREKAWQGFIERGYDKLGSKYLDRFNYEIENISGAGFADYFLILEEMFNWYRNDLHSISAFGRGSAAGSLILNCIGCTNVDPIKNNLLFERFLDAERFRLIVEAGGEVTGDMCPDVDSDMAKPKKELVKEHLAEVYGKNSIASIGTAGTMKTKTTLKDLARLYNVPAEEVNAITTNEMRDCRDEDEEGNPIPLEKLKKDYPGLARLLQKYPEMGRAFEKLRGSISSWGKHPGGVLIVDFDLTKQLPVRPDAEGNGKMTTCWQEGIASRELGKMGFVKFDILAIEQLNIFEHALRLIKERTGKELRIEDIPLDDPKALDQMNKLDTACVFQFDTEVAPRVIKNMNGIRRFEDLSALSTLMRPAALANKFDVEFGKRRQSGEAVYVPDCLKPFFAETYGLPIYQEHIYQAAMHLSNFGKNDAYKFMKLIYKGKLHDPSDVNKWKNQFISGAQPKVDAGEVKAGYPEKLFNELMAFLGYGFCSAHARSYSMYSAVGLWLKKYYPLEYLSANLTVSDRSKGETELIVRYCASRGIKVLAPNVQQSHPSEWTIVDNALLAPLGCLKGFPTAEAESIAKLRPFKSLLDFADKTNIGKSRFDILVFGGALDDFGEREYLYNWYHEFYEKRSKSKQPRTMDLLFDFSEDDDESDSFEIKTIFKQADLDMLFSEMVGFTVLEDLKGKYSNYLSTHPNVKTVAEALKKKPKRFRMLCKINRAEGFKSKTGREFIKLELTDGVETYGTVMNKELWKNYQTRLEAGLITVLPMRGVETGNLYIDPDREEIEILEGL